MRSLPLLAGLPAPLVIAFSFNSWDLGFYGLYPRQHFQSVDFEPPAPKITKWDSRCDSGKLFLTPRGPLVSGAARGPVILDPKGELIWMDNTKFEQAMNFNVQKYKGQDYLTFWAKHKKGKKHKNEKDRTDKEIKETKKTKRAKHPKKSYVMLDSSYNIAYRIYPVGDGMKGDSHEFRITSQGTALITIYYKHQADCTKLGLGKSCWIQDGLFQEIDIETGELIFEWRATEHISMTDVFSTPCRKDGYGTSKKDAFDFFHINSVEKIPSGDYIISARYMHAVVCISGKTGEILWQLGGKHNNFKEVGGALDFSWQHHVSWQGNNTISLFDNHANNVFHSPSSHSKGMIIQLDMDSMTASLVGKYVHPDEILNVSQGSVQVLPDSGNVLVGFGNSPTYVEYAPDGTVLCSAHFAPHLVFETLDFGLVKSYRVFKNEWVGRPKTVPDVKVKGGKAYVSWNGATEVTGWRLEKATTKEVVGNDFATIQELRRDGFETAFDLKGSGGYVRITALDQKSNAMATSVAVKASSSFSISLWSILSFLLTLDLFMFGFAVLISCVVFSVFLCGRIPRRFNLRGLPKLKFGSRWRSKVRSDADCDVDDEFAPLLLDERNV